MTNTSPREGRCAGARAAMLVFAAVSMTGRRCERDGGPSPTDPDPGPHRAMYGALGGSASSPSPSRRLGCAKGGGSDVRLECHGRRRSRPLGEAQRGGTNSSRDSCQSDSRTLPVEDPPGPRRTSSISPATRRRETKP